MANTLSREAAERARELRRTRRTRSGSRARAFQDIADILRLEGRGKHTPLDVADAIAGLPLEDHELAPPSDAAAAELRAVMAPGMDRRVSQGAVAWTGSGPKAPSREAPAPARAPPESLRLGHS